MSRRKILENTASYQDNLLNSLRDPKEAAAYLQAAFDEYQLDNDFHAFLLAIRNVTKARGGISELAKKSHLNRQSLYKTLSSSGNPKLDTFGAIMKGLGFMITITPDKHINRN
ncbi:MAG: addiction module antidote protein [Candidatus Berkiellales bacterium]